MKISLNVKQRKLTLPYSRETKIKYKNNFQALQT